jgi:hypothetical protein
MNCDEEKTLVLWPDSLHLISDYDDGTHTWKYYDGQLEWHSKWGITHRDGDKPAIIWPSGRMDWFQHGKRHRITGPAIIKPNGECYWFLNNIEITQSVEKWLLSRKYSLPLTYEQQIEFQLVFV